MSEGTFLQSVVILCATTGFVASLQLVRRYLELRRDRPATPPPGADAGDGVNARLARIEEIAEVTALEVERLAETNRYLAKLLAERGGVALPAGRPERVVTPH
jgi:hypothetical protein